MTDNGNATSWEPTDDELRSGLQARIDAGDMQVQHLLDEAKRIQDETYRYKRALRALDGPDPAKAKPKPKSTSAGTKIGEERMTKIKNEILRLAREKDEFRQVDVRSALDINSSVSATAFEKLRQEGFIRLARAEGNSKFYRLTKPALGELRDTPGQVVESV
jgi:hypothetical protein